MPGERPVVRSSPVTIVLSLVLLAGALYVGFTPLGAAPALGAFLDPVHGVWSVATRANLAPTESEAIHGLSAPVDVRYDDRGVPHIFAKNTLDAMRALGWVHARDRLFQMEIQTRAVAGTLSELAGPRTLPLDRESRLQGLAWSAERNTAIIDTSSESGREALAYSDGVNTFIDHMSAADMPFEYHLLGAHPQRWKPAYSAYLLARMGLTLTLEVSNWELKRAQADALVGKAATDVLFPMNEPLQEPIQPNGQKSVRADWITIPAPAAPNAQKLALSQAMARALAAVETATLPMSPGAQQDVATGEFAVGSNNWAVSPKRTAAGHALLAGDPHLALSMPSIWYEAHIVVADTLDAYGVTLPGAPFVAIGFNRNVAWSETNTGADVADYYAETVDNDAHPGKYKLDGEWKPLELRIETFHDKKGKTLATDTIYHSHRGPMLRVGTQWVSRRWTVLDPSDALRPFRDLNKAKTSAELMRAIEPYAVPAQNFITADRDGHIAIRSTGHFPVRAANANGDALIDGSLSANDWKGWWPVSDYPQSFDPAQGYLASNNQQPKDPKVDPRYFGHDWATAWRAMRINTLLRADSLVTPDAMRLFQTDPTSAQPQYFLPFIHAAAAAVPAGSDSGLIVRASKLLDSWDGKFTKENERAILYEYVIDEISRRTWDELRIPDKSASGGYYMAATPNSMILLELMQDPKNIWWDDRSTPNVVEDRDAIIRAAIAAAYRRVVVEHGEEGLNWRWDQIRHANIYHLLRLPALSRLNIPVQGGSTTLAPALAAGTHGASWRMVVELGPDVRAWGTYPGGQSGNPSSKRYDDRLAHWSAGILDTLRFPRRAAELAGPTLTSHLTLTTEKPGR